MQYSGAYTDFIEGNMGESGSTMFELLAKLSACLMQDSATRDSCCDPKVTLEGSCEGYKEEGNGS
jgi:hypothetical protein